MIRIGGPIFEKPPDPSGWVAAHRALGYSAAYAPDGLDASAIREFEDAARDADLVIAEVGAWSNPISPDAAEREQAMRRCCDRLAYAEQIGARCCVNIAGSRGQVWDGPHPENLSDDTFDLIVQSVRQIIDSVKPKRTRYALETMPWVLPDSPQSYLRLLEAIDRPAFGVHLDPVNMINCPSRAYRTGAFIRECFELLAPHIISCHAKDIAFTQHLTVHLSECRPGTGLIDYATFLRQLDALGRDVTLMLEHLKGAEQYALAADHLRQVARSAGVSLR